MRGDLRDGGRLPRRGNVSFPAARVKCRPRRPDLAGSAPPTKGRSPMAGLEVKSVSSPDEVRPFADHGNAAVVTVGGRPVIYGTFEPGWRWSEDLKPIAGTHSCEASHALYVISGRMAVRMDDGQEGEIGPGDVATIEPGHDAWVVGDEPCVA